MRVGGGVDAAHAPARTGPGEDLQLDDATSATTVDEMIKCTTSTTEKERRRLDRLAIDSELVAHVRASGCTGPLYAALEVELVRYGRSVLTTWVKRGQIFAGVQTIGRAVPAPGWARTMLYDDVHEREDLVAMVIAEALPTFRRDALEGGRWRAEAGASITTYFVNLLVRTFPNHYRSWLAQQERWSPRGLAEATMFDTQRQPVNDPGVIVSLRTEIEDELNKLNPRHRRMMSDYITGYSQAEIAKAEGISEKAVERVISRSREALQRFKTRQVKERAWSTSTV